MKTALCDTLGIEHPILAAPMGPDLTGPDLVAAVSNPRGNFEITCAARGSLREAG